MWYISFPSRPLAPGIGTIGTIRFSDESKDNKGVGRPGVEMGRGSAFWGIGGEGGVSPRIRAFGYGANPPPPVGAVLRLGVSS